MLAPYSVPLDPTLLAENGGLFTVGSSPLTKAVAVPLVTGGPDVYWRVGNGARWKWSGVSATYMEIDMWATVAGGNSVCGVLVNDGVKLWPLYSKQPEYAPGLNTIRMLLPPGASKTVELFVPMQNATTKGGIPAGAYPVRVRFSSPATAVAPPTPTVRLGVYGDSITSGGVSICQTLNGFCGLMKRGLSAQTGSNWLAAYNGATAYVAGNVVSSGNWIWQASQATTGNAPAIGSSFWNLLGYNGSVTQISYGTRCLADDASTGGAQTAFATAIAALGLTKLMLFIGSNDQAVIPATTLANFSSFYAGLLAALFVAQPALNLVCVSPTLRQNPEVANANGNTMTQFRSAIQTAQAAASSPSSYVDGSTLLTYASISGADGVHPTTQGNVALMAALQPFL